MDSNWFQELFINEAGAALSASGDSISDEQVSAAVDAYLEENPVGSATAVVEDGVLKVTDNGTYSGTFIDFDAVEGQKVRVSGDTTEAVTLWHRGENLFMPYADGVQTSANGTTMTPNEDGTFTVSGTPTTTTWFNVFGHSNNSNGTLYLPAGIYSVIPYGFSEDGSNPATFVLESVGGAVLAAVCTKYVDVAGNVAGIANFTLEEGSFCRGTLTINTSFISDMSLGIMIVRNEDSTLYDVNHPYETPVLSKIVGTLPIEISAYDGVNTLYIENDTPIEVRTVKHIDEVVAEAISEHVDKLEQDIDCLKTKISGEVVSFSAEKGQRVVVSGDITEPVTLVHRGKNLLYLSPGTGKSSGIAWSTNDDGTVHLSGTATNDVFINLGIGSEYLPAGVYALSSNMPSTGDDGASVVVYPNETGAFTALGACSAWDPVTITINASASAGCYIRMLSGYTIDADVWFQLERGRTHTEFEPYHGEQYDNVVLPVNLSAFEGLNFVHTSSGDLVTASFIQKNVGFDYSKYGLPILYLDGDDSVMSKENSVELTYTYGELTGVASVKWQGSSSLAYPKKNYTIKFDNAFEAKEGWGERSKYCLKANYIDHSHARNVVNAKLWGQIVKSRVAYNGDFDISKVTGAVNHLGLDKSQHITVSEDGVLTNNTSNASVGPTFFTGNTFKRGTYTLTFDYLIPHDTTTDPRGVIKVCTGNPTSWVDGFCFSGTARNQWVTYTCEIEVPSDDYMLCLVCDGCPEMMHNVGYQFRNITVVGENNYLNTTDALNKLPNGGAIDGFPCVITLNGDFHGLYTFNIPKDGWMFGMSDETAQQAIICADGAATNACGFKGLATLDGDFDLEYVSDEDNSDWVLTSLNNLITSVMNSDGTDLDTNVAKYLDWESAIDYFIFTVLIGGSDMYRKNYLLSTYDGTKWFFSAYDMDTTYGIEWDGNSFHLASKYPKMTDYNHRVMELIQTYKTDKVKARYAELRNTVLSEDNVCLAFSNYVAGIPTPLLVEDVRKWPTIPSSAISNTAQILNWYRMRVLAMDKDIELLG